LVGTGVASLAVLSDQIVVRSTFAAALVDLQASEDGTAYEQSLDLVWTPVESGQPLDQVYAIQIKNASNVEIRFAGVATAVLTPPNNGFAGVGFNIFNVASQAACVTGIPTAGALSTGGTIDAASFGSPAPGQQAGDQVLATGATQWLCLNIRFGGAGPTFGATDSAIQQLTLSAEATS
jgi:hypothetical protein